METSKQNGRFYKDCVAYFRFLRTTGSADHAFEDEYYFTMPAISGGQ